MNVLVVAPHPDDEAIGCGGALLLHAAAGDRVTAVFLTSGELGLRTLPREEAWRTREGEAERAGEVLALSSLHFLRAPDWFLGDAVDVAAARLRPILAREAPALVYAPHAAEWHPDHRAALPILLRALAPDAAAVTEVRTYEVWTPLAEYAHAHDVTAVMARKLRALRCHASQLREFRYDRAVRGLNAYRGALATRTRYAEVFGAADPGG